MAKPEQLQQFDKHLLNFKFLLVSIIVLSYCIYLIIKNRYFQGRSIIRTTSIIFVSVKFE